MMKRQLYEDGGLGLVPREQYGVGSFLKKTFKKVTKPFVKVAQKLVPKEIAKPLMVAAPFLGPYAPLIYAAGSAKATGGIDPMKLALTAAPYVKFDQRNGLSASESTAEVRISLDKLNAMIHNLKPSSEVKHFFHHILNTLLPTTLQSRLFYEKVTTNT